MTVWVPFYCDNKVLDGRQYFQIGNVIIAIRPTFMKYIFRVDLNESETTNEATRLLGNHEKNQKYGSHLGHKQRSYTVSCCPIRGCQKTFTKDEFLLDHIKKKHIFTENLKQGSRIIADEHRQSADMENSMQGSKMTEDEPKQSGDMENVNHNTDKSAETEEAINVEYEASIDSVTTNNTFYGGGSNERQAEEYSVNLCRRADVLNMSIPDIKHSTSEIYLSVVDDTVVQDPKTSAFMPPTTQVDKINQCFRRDLSLKYVKLDFGIFSKESLVYFKKLHESKILLHKVLAEENWFADIPAIPSESLLALDNIKCFKNILFKNSDSKVVAINNLQIEIKDLSDICCDRWLNDSVISNVIHLINKDANDHKCFVHILNSTDNMQSLADTLKKKFYNSFGGVRLGFCTHVGNLKGFSFLNSCNIDDSEYSANHFTTCVYSFDSNKLFYCDTLGWNIPELLEHKISELLHCLQIQNFSVCLSHDPYSFVERETSISHVCSNKCSPFYFIQQCSAVCGVAALITLVIVSYKWLLFESFVSVSGKINELESISYLRNISSYSKYLRLAIIDWLVSGSIDIKKILKPLNSFSQGASLSFGKNGTTNSKSASCSQMLSTMDSSDAASSFADKTANVENCCLTVPPLESEAGPNFGDKEFIAELIYNNSNSNSDTVSQTHQNDVGIANMKSTNTLFNNWQLDITSLESYISSKPEVSYIKSKDHVRLRFTLNNGRKISKTFKCKTEKESVKDTIKAFLFSNECSMWVKSKSSEMAVTLEDSHIPEAFPGINQLLTRPYQVTYTRNKLRVRCFLRNGQTKDKYFSCSTLGKKDSAALMSVTSYFKTQECLEWLKSDETWIKVGTVPAGPHTKQFLNKISFDVTKKYSIHKDVEKYYDPDTLSVSITENENWGKTNRTDQMYRTAANGNFTAVTLYIKCASKSDVCRGECGILVSTLKEESGLCPNCNFSITSSNAKECHNCQATISPQWTKDKNGNTVCKTCYEYYRRNKKFKSSVSNPPKIVLHSHFTCKWQIKLVLESGDLANWSVYEFKTNSFYHPRETVQASRRANLQTRDTWDLLRISTKATPQQILGTDNRANSIRISTTKNNFHNLKKIKARCRTVDQHYLKSGMKSSDEIPIHSDWRNCEKVLEGNFRNVLLFQRGEVDLNRCFHIVLCRDENSSNLREFGQHILGYDIKQDFMSARFKTACITYTDTVSSGRAGAVAICNAEDENSHALTLQMVLGNIHCDRSDCLHEKQLYLFNDKSGFFWLRPCAINSPIQPIIQHDKAQDIRNAVIHQNLMSTLCNFHALKAYRSYIRENSDLEILVRPLETAFKCIMRSWNSIMTDSLIERFKHFIMDTIPEQFMTQHAKDNLLSYMQKQWFSCNWKGVFTAEVFQLVPPFERRDPLLLTDNVTERKFKEFDENDFGSHLNRSIAILVLKFLNNILYRESVQTEENRLRKKACTDRPGQTTLALLGINLCMKKQVLTSTDWKETGWALVQSEKANIKHLPDDFFTSNIENDTADHNIDIPHPSSTTLEEVRNSAISLVTEHAYSVVDKCKRIVSDLNSLALDMYYKENLSYLPDELKALVGNKTHICNIKLCTCTCFHFIVRGQPYFCKHLYACLAELHSVNNSQDLVDLYLKTFPCFPHVFGPYLRETIELNTNFDKVLRLIEISHVASEEEYRAAGEGNLLKVLHTSDDTGTTLCGRPAQRKPHNAGFRSKGGPITDNYSLIDGQLELSKDPYRPNVKFPDNSRERHGGRKLQKASKRGVSFSSVMQSALKKMGAKLINNASSINKTNASQPSPNNEIPDSQLFPANASSIDHNNILNMSTKNQLPKKTESKVKNNYIMCAKCVQDGSSPPFSCASKLQLDRHISLKHKEENYMCAFCFTQYNALTYFATDRLLREHQNDHATHTPISAAKPKDLVSTSSTGCNKTANFKEYNQKNPAEPILSAKLTALDSASDSTLNEIANSKKPGIANLAKMKLNVRDITPKTATQLLKEKQIEELHKQA